MSNSGAFFRKRGTMESLIDFHFASLSTSRVRRAGSSNDNFLPRHCDNFPTFFIRQNEKGKT